MKAHRRVDAGMFFIDCDDISARFAFSRRKDSKWKKLVRKFCHLSFSNLIHIPMRILLFSFLGCLPLIAQDGGQLYGLYCSACHGADGKGATGGQFPPLAGSPWVQGNAERPIKIVLHGLHGPVDVNGKTYNLEMPPQGAALADDNIAAILTHVRKSWGNDASAVTVEQVKQVRAATAQRKEHWSAEELLKLHPLENVKPALSSLLSYYYKGSFQQMPDFSKLKPDAVEEEPKGIIDYSSYANTNHFAMVWEGEFEVTEGGKHEFLLDSDDGSRLFIDGKILCEIKTVGPVGRAQRKAIDLKPGKHKIRVEYFEFEGFEGLVVGVKPPKQRNYLWLSKESAQGSGKAWPEIMLKPEAGRAVLYRNFIEGSTARGIGLGFPGEVNMVYSADHLGVELLWQGNFIDAGHHWTDRGIGYEPPASDEVITVSKNRVFALTSEAAQGWTDQSQCQPRFRGYQLSKEGNPTFLVEIDGVRVFDSYQAISSPAKGIQRGVRLSAKPKTAVSLLIHRGATAQNQPQSFVAGELQVTIKGGTFRYAQDAVILDLTSDQVEIQYAW